MEHYEYEKTVVREGRIAEDITYQLVHIIDHYFSGKSWYCGYIEAPFYFIEQIAKELNKVREITYPYEGIAAILSREKEDKVGFDTQQIDDIDEASKILDKWIEIVSEHNKKPRQVYKEEEIECVMTDIDFISFYGRSITEEKTVYIKWKDGSTTIITKDTFPVAMSDFDRFYKIVTHLNFYK